MQFAICSLIDDDDLTLAQIKEDTTCRPAQQYNTHRRFLHSHQSSLISHH